MSTITSLGIGSGLDINKTVSDLIAAERQPTENRLAAAEQEYKAKFSAYGTLQSAVSLFNDSLSGLRNPSTFESRSASSSNTDLFTATASTSAVAGTYEIEVLARAEQHKLMSAADQGWSSDTAIGTGTLDIGVGDSSFQVTIDSSNDTLEGIRDAINEASDNAGVTASIINVDDSGGDTEARLVLTADDPGTANAVTVGVTDDDGNHTDASGLSTLRYDGTASNLVESNAAADAQIAVDGQTATRSTNTFSDVLEGVTINVEKAEVGTVETLAVTRSSGSVKSEINGMVKAYNALMQTVRGLTKYNSETGQAAILLGDAAARGLEVQARQGLTDLVEGMDGDIQSLADLGITVGTNRQLVVDSDQLDSALEGNLDEVKDLFTSDDGVAKRLDAITDGYLGSDGILGNRTDGMQARLDDIADQREALDRRMENLRDRYTAQFIAMDQIVAQMNATQDQLTQQLATLPGAPTQNDS